MQTIGPCGCSIGSEMAEKVAKSETASGGTEDRRARLQAVSSGPELDDKDLQLIAELQINGRANYADLAKGIDLSPAAVRLRVNRLIDSGIVEIVAVTDPLSIGFRVQAMVGLTVDGDIEALSDEIRSRSYAVYVGIRF